MRLVSQRCARYSTTPVTTREHQRGDHVGQPGRLAARRVERGVLLGEDGVRGGQQHQVRLLRGDLEERAAGQRVAHRVLGCRLADVAGVGGQPAAQRGEGGARRLAAAAACSPARSRGGASRGRPGSAAAGERRLGLARNAAVIVASASAIDWYICLASRLSGSSAWRGRRRRRSAGWPPSRRRRPRRATSRTRPASSARSAAGVLRRCGGAARGLRRRGGGPGRGGRRGPPGGREGGGHEPISAICCSPSVTSAPGSGWKPTVVQVGTTPVARGDDPAQEGPERAGLGGVRLRALTTAYS